jgi:hypothetical protein
MMKAKRNTYFNIDYRFQSSDTIPIPKSHLHLSQDSALPAMRHADTCARAIGVQRAVVSTLEGEYIYVSKLRMLFPGLSYLQDTNGFQAVRWGWETRAEDMMFALDVQRTLLRDTGEPHGWL